MLSFETLNDNPIWLLSFFNNVYDKGHFKKEIDDIDTFYIVSSKHLMTDDMDGNHERDNPDWIQNRELVNISPYIMRGEFVDACTVKILVSHENDLSDIKAVCKKFPNKKFYFSMGISTFPLNDEFAPIKNITNELHRLNVDNLHISFINGWDMYLDSDRHFNRLKKFKAELSDWPEERLQFLMANFQIVEDYKNAFKNADVQYYSIYPIRIADSVGKVSYPKYITKEEKNKNKLRTRKLICLNNFKKDHRTKIVELLKGYEKEVYYSYRAENIKLPKEFVPDFGREKVDHDFMINQDSPPYRLVKNNYCWVACETFFDNFASHNYPAPEKSGSRLIQGFITEKTYKAFYFELPVFIVGLPYSYKWIKSLGFETFPEFFNEDFDSILDPEKRMQKVQFELKKFLDTPLEQLSEKFWSSTVQEKIHHNKRLILDLAKNDPFNKLAYKFKHKRFM